MKAFEFDSSLIENYAHFSQSFSALRATDLKSQVEALYQDGHFWPDPLLSLNPRYEEGPTTAELISTGDLDKATGEIFRFGAEPLRFHRHQAQAIAKARAGQSFVVTTGTGSGKSLCFFVPIVDAIVRAKKADKSRRTRAIIVYPMNALANSQIKEIEKFISQSGLPKELLPTVARYTGQEGQEERQRIAANPPDILLTNFMMAELLLTRQDEQDTRVVENTKGLEFIVLDELHTYRGRQGADVAILVRRLRDRCAGEKAPICIGTSATMASEGSDDGRALAVSQVASRLFGASIGPDAVIDEALRRSTDDSIEIADVIPALGATINQGIPSELTDDQLKKHPLAVWCELALGLDDGKDLKRKRPIPFGEAVQELKKASGESQDQCQQVLETFLTLVSLPEKDRGGSGDAAFLAFKLHRFVSGAGEFFTTLTDHPRTVLLDGQLEDPNNPGHRMYPTRFCRECGQEYHVVTKVERDGRTSFIPRNIDDTPIDDDEEEDIAGYLTPTGEGDADYRFSGEIESYPETWVEEHRGVERLRSYRRARAPQPVTVGADGRVGSSGMDFWFLPGKFGFCTCCLHEPSTGMRERSKLAGLSGEGRSSATTLLVSTALEWLNAPSSNVPKDKRKLLGFTDNRQDAALQAGHFNDFLFVSLLRGAILRAVLDEGSYGLREEEFGLRVVRALGFTANNKDARVHWMLDPTAGTVIREDAERALAKVMAHRVWTDLRRGWRFTNPSLSILNLVALDFVGLDEIAGDQERFTAILPEFGALPTQDRREVLRTFLEAMIEGLAVRTEALELPILDTTAQNSRSLLRSPWSIDQKESLQGQSILYLQPPRRGNIGLREEKTILRAGHNSRIAKLINKRSMLGVKLGKDDYLRVMEEVLSYLSEEGLLTPVSLDDDHQGWQLSPSAVRLVPGAAVNDAQFRGNAYFHDLYTSIAADLKGGHSSYWGLESREHTAQVTQLQREWREWRFRFEDDDIAKLEEHALQIKESGESVQFLPAMFCSPTMELGVDISALNAVYLRNVPPTPANYAQRAGRAGRSGQAAVVFTYCAAQSPHDQYFFERRNDMVSGIVKPPALDITNRDLVTSHLHAVWLAEAKLALSPDIPLILDLENEDYPLKPEILTVVQASSLLERSKAPMGRVLAQILHSLGGEMPKWLTSPEEFVAEVAAEAPREFDKAFNRWRELYNSARTQLIEANKKSQQAGLSASDRRKIRAAQAQANDQITILEQGKASNGSDFYSYRYLATEGFLPGYNFPRLPLYAFVPGEGKSGAYLQRARFLAIAEFGPRSLIYHEGRAFRVMKAKLPPETRTADGQELATKEITICPNCGASHEEEVERCHACDHSMAGELPVKRTLRIDNVEAAPAERITANDEERVRQGFEIQTVFSWPQKAGKSNITEAQYLAGGKRLLDLQYANSAEISRINKGLRRRKDQTVLGFLIDPRTGYWAKTPDEDADTDPPPDAVQPVRIVPIVRDHKNALLFRFHRPDLYEPETLATVQHALMRGIEVVFQLEEGEILGEPLPKRDDRRTILAYEATEGGAGVLSRLVEDENALRRVALAALNLMHFKEVDAAVADGDASLLKDADDACVRGCYRCLLSYFNQPDHELIDRVSDEAKQLLVDLARGELTTSATSGTSSSAEAWISAFTQAELPSPDAKPIMFGEQQAQFAWRDHYVAAAIGQASEQANDIAAEKGWTIVSLPAEPNEGVPTELIELLGGAYHD